MTHRVLLLALLITAISRVSWAQMPLEDKFFDSNGVRIRYVEAGRGDPVVLIHGGVGNLDMMWRDARVLEALARDFHVIAFDVRGHGKSDKPHGVASYRGEIVEDVRRLLDHLRIRRAHIVGYSMGGYIAAKFSALHPARVVTATFGGSGAWSPEFERLLSETAESLERGDGLAPLLATTLAMPDGRRPSREDLDAQSHRALASNDPLALAAAVRGVIESHASPMELRALPMPLLAIVGSADPRKESVEALKRIKPDLKVVSIEGATHLGPTGAQGRPEFVAALREFFAAHPSGQDSQR